MDTAVGRRSVRGADAAAAASGLRMTRATLELTARLSGVAVVTGGASKARVTGDGIVTARDVRAMRRRAAVVARRLDRRAASTRTDSAATSVTAALGLRPLGFGGPAGRLSLPPSQFRRQCAVAGLTVGPSAGIGARRHASSGGTSGSAAGEVLSDTSGTAADAATDAVAAAADVEAAVVAAGELSEKAAAAVDTLSGNGIGAWAMRFMEWIHETGGMPWWAAIATATLAMRLAIMPMFFKSLANGAKMQKLQPQLKDINDRMQVARAAGNKEHMLAINAERKALMKSEDVSMAKSFVPILIQLPAFMAFVWGLRAASEAPHLFQGLTEGGLFWWTDLTQRDQFFSLPIMSAAFSLGAIELNKNIQDNQMWTAATMKKWFRIMAVGFIPITGMFPACLHVYFATTSFTMLLQTSVLHIKAVRDVIGLPEEWPVKPHTDGAGADGEYVTMFQGLQQPKPPPPPSTPPPGSPLSHLPPPPTQMPGAPPLEADRLSDSVQHEAAAPAGVVVREAPVAKLARLQAAMAATESAVAELTAAGAEVEATIRPPATAAAAAESRATPVARGKTGKQANAKNATAARKKSKKGGKKKRRSAK